jgi:hypothetical protein
MRTFLIPCILAEDPAFTIYPLSNYRGTSKSVLTTSRSLKKTLMHGLSHCILCNRGFDRHKSFVGHQREAHSSDATRSPAVYKDIKSINASAAIYKPRTGSKRAAGEAHPTDKLTDPRLVAEAGDETEFATQGETLIGEETLFVDEVPTVAKAGESRHSREFALDELASADESATGDETISDDQLLRTTLIAY